MRLAGVSQSRRARTLAFVVSLVIVPALLQSCDSETERKRVEAQVLHSFRLPSDYVLVDEWEDGNGGGGPMLVYALGGPGVGVLEADDVRAPGMYSREPASRGRYQLFVPSLAHSVTWRKFLAYRGPTPEAGGECLVLVDQSVDMSPPLVLLGAACDLTGAV